MHAEEVVIESDGPPRLRAELAGEHIDRTRHALASDIKATTAHGLRVEETSEGWRACATFDV